MSSCECRIPDPRSVPSRPACSDLDRSPVTSILDKVGLALLLTLGLNAAGPAIPVEAIGTAPTLGTAGSFAVLGAARSPTPVPASSSANWA